MSFRILNADAALLTRGELVCGQVGHCWNPVSFCLILCPLAFEVFGIDCAIGDKLVVLRQ
jgi:hypothetical protein